MTGRVSLPRERGSRYHWLLVAARRSAADSSLTGVVAIVTSGLSKRYGHSGPPIHPPWIHPAAEVRALEDLSIEVREGEIFGFLGPNGAGKSTTIRLLLGFLHPSAGAASVLGLDIVRESVEIRRRTGYLPGGIALYDTMSGERPARLPRRPDRPAGDPPGRARRPARAVARRRCAAWSATTRAGMRQKIGIIQALQHDPELAILDEPTEGLDPLMQRAFYEILDELPRRRPDDLLLVARPVRGRARLRPGRDRPARTAGRARGRRGAARPPQAATSRCGSRALRRRSRACRASRRRRRARRAHHLPPRGRRRAVPGRDRATSASLDLTIEPARLEEAFLELYHDEIDEPPSDRPAAEEAPA